MSAKGKKQPKTLVMPSLAELTKNVEELEYRLIPMRCGVQSKLWIKNTCAIGLSAGFIEPLHSNGLHSTHEFLYNLVRTLAPGRIN